MVRPYCLLLCVGLSGCVGEIGTGEDEPSSPSRGAIDGTETTLEPEVGQIQLGSVCTGTLITDDVVLTAAHCIHSNDGGFWMTDKFDKQAAYAFQAAKIREFGVEVSPGDLAIAQLAKHVPSSVADPAPIAASYPAVGAKATIYGYGCHPLPDGGYGQSGVKRSVEIQYGVPTSVGCLGDSGGPTLVNGQIVAITSGNGNGYSGDIVFADPIAYRSKILETIALWDQGLDCAGLGHDACTSQSACSWSDCDQSCHYSDESATCQHGAVYCSFQSASDNCGGDGGCIAIQCENQVNAKCYPLGTSADSVCSNQTPTSGTDPAPAVCPCSEPGVSNMDNFCSHPPSTPGCPMTFPGGYCDPNGDGSFTDGDWVQGYNAYQASCG